MCVCVCVGGWVGACMCVCMSEDELIDDLEDRLAQVQCMRCVCVCVFVRVFCELG